MKDDATFDRDAAATREFTIRDCLIYHCDCVLTPDRLEQIVAQIVREMESGSTAWAFGSKAGAQ